MVDNLIRVFPSDINPNTDFQTNGLGCLSDAASCVVTEKRNDLFELVMKYPITGIHYDKIELRRIIMAKPNPYEDPQPFRVYSISKPIKGIVTVNAYHISYDLSGYPVGPFSANSIGEAFLNFKAASVLDCPFIFGTDKTVVGKMSNEKPASMRSMLAGSSGSFLDVYGTGEYKFDRYSVYLYLHRGDDHGVEIRYGKNMTDLEQEENCSSVYTGVYPYWYTEEDGLVELPEKVIYAEGTFNFTKIKVLDLAESFEEKPSIEAIRSKTESYIRNNNIGVPDVSLKVSFAQLSKDHEYGTLSLLERVNLCDTVHVYFEQLGVVATAKCIETAYNVITQSYDSIKLGSTKTDLENVLAEKFKEVDELPDRSEISNIASEATKLITGGFGGYVSIRSSTGGTHPDEILIMDTPDILTAGSVWRWNQNGLGFSSTGYNGDYKTAITADGKIVADFIGAGTINSSLLLSGVIETINKHVKIDDGGIYIRNENSGTETFIDNEQFAIKYNGNVVLTVNKDWTILNRVEITDDLIFGNIVFTRTEHGMCIYSMIDEEEENV